ncbi:Aspartic proteinase nepenthesin-1 [Hordeum vulgare]|nr:Aspartic proteinase nepenthesin-1 [Hordeum vulgare]
MRSQTVKKVNSNDSRTNVIQLCGGLGIQKRGRSTYPQMTLPESVRNWQSTWFYCNDVASPNMLTGLPPITLDRPTAPRTITVFEDEKAEVEMLVAEVINLVRSGLRGMDLLKTFLGRRIQPLQSRDHAMWHYPGPGDSTQSHPGEVSEETVVEWIKSITGPCDNPMGSKRVAPYSAENKPWKLVCCILSYCFHASVE